MVDSAGAGCDLTRYTYDAYGARLTMATPQAIKAGSTAVYSYTYSAGVTTDLSDVYRPVQCRSSGWHRRPAHAVRRSPRCW